MGFFDRLFGGAPPQHRPVGVGPQAADEQAIARYRYLLRTAPPEAIEEAHAEAFAQLTAEQRTQVLRDLSTELPASERAAFASSADPRQLARLATRTELRRPGTIERTLGGGGMNMGMGGMIAGSLLSSIAGTFIGTAIAHQFLGGFHDDGGGNDPGYDGGGGAQDDSADASDSFGGDFGGDSGGDFGDFGDV